MSAAEKALAALEAAGKAATPRPWSVTHRHASCTVNDDEQCGLGLEIEGPPEASMRGQFALAADASLIVAAVNLSAPLAAVARAAMARPWKSGAICVMCGGIQAAFGGKIEHVDECQFGDLDAALDALEAAAEGVV